METGVTLNLVKNNLNYWQGDWASRSVIQGQ